jgi:hypothetical protein
MAQNVCPTCGSTYDAAQQFCPKDGTVLRSAESRRPTPNDGIGTLVGARATSEEEAQRIKALLAADPNYRKAAPAGVPKPTDPMSRPSVSSEPRRNIVGIVIGVLVLAAVVALIALAMRK